MTGPLRSRLTCILLAGMLTLLTACSAALSPRPGATSEPSSTHRISSTAAPSALSAPSVDPPAPESSAGTASPDHPTLGTDDVDPAAVVTAPVRLTVPSAEIDVPIFALTPTENELASQSIVPPFTLDAYWLTSYGSPGEGSTNTTYITGHSWEDREAPFNRLSTDAVVGDLLTITTDIGVLDYVVESVTTHDKDTLRSSDIWGIVPHRLVLISCYTDDLWGKNVIVTAVPAN